jgi:hypothetical membrane protein
MFPLTSHPHRRDITMTTAPSRTSVNTLLTCGIVAGPLYVAVVAIQMLTRDGYDITRHAASLLSNGELGWIQITNFVVTGLLTIAAAIGMRQALRAERGGRGSTWGPRLIGAYGVSLIGAGMFVADPAFGFPAGTPAGAPTTISWHGALHFIVGGVGFLALIAACFVFARRFSAVGQRGWAVFSVLTGVVFFAAFAGIASGASSLTIPFAVAVVLAWAWVSALAARLRARSTT